jgi:hypothetical protein
VCQQIHALELTDIVSTRERYLIETQLFEASGDDAGVVDVQLHRRLQRRPPSDDVSHPVEWR